MYPPILATSIHCAIIIMVLVGSSFSAAKAISEPYSAQFIADASPSQHLNLVQLIDAAENQDANAQYELANYYLAKNDYENAIYWAEKSAQKKNIALNQLGIIYHTMGQQASDKNLAQSYFDKSRQYYEQASAKHVPHAQYNLAKMYFNSVGVPKDLVKSAKYLKLAANNNLLDAQNYLGAMYLKGYGVKKNDEKAVYWFKRAAKYGFTESIFNLGIAYYNGQGIAKDHQKAEELFYQSCLAGKDQGCELYAKLFD